MNIEDVLDEAKEMLNAEWDDHISAERAAHMRLFDLQVANRKETWIRNRLSALLSRPAESKPVTVRREECRNVSPVGTSLILSQLNPGTIHTWPNIDDGAVKAIRSTIQYLQKKKGYSYQTESTRSTHNADTFTLVVMRNANPV